MSRSSLGVLSVVGRWNEARYKRGKRDGNLNKSTFLKFGSSYLYSMCCAFPQSGDSSGATLEVPSEALLHLWFIVGI